MTDSALGRGSLRGAPGSVAAAEKDVPPQGSRGLALLRIVLGITWLHEAAWKIPPDFGRATDSGLWDWTNRALEHPVLPPYNWLVEAVVIPNFTLFGWLVFLTEAALGGFLLVGLSTRLWGAAGFVMALPITFSVLNVPGEWSYAYYIYLAAHVAVAAGAAGRCCGVDAIIRQSNGTDTRMTRMLWRLA